MTSQAVSHEQTTTQDSVPLSRHLEQEIAERMLASALYNYHSVFTKGMPLLEFKTWFDLTPEQQAFLLDHAVPTAIQAVWKGR